MRKPKKEVIVSKAWVKNYLEKQPLNRRIELVGRALSAIYARQTELERAALVTNVNNSSGFTAYDAEYGSVCAKYFNSVGTLQNRHYYYWTKDIKGFPRIARYHRQLNEIALARKCEREATE